MRKKGLEPSKMDIGREVKRISGNNYSRRFIFKEEGEIKYASKERIGNLLPSNIDSKKRIYIPQGLWNINFLDDRWNDFSGSLLCLNVFKFITLFLKKHDYLDWHDFPADLELSDEFHRLQEEYLRRNRKRINENERNELIAFQNECRERQKELFIRMQERIDIKARIITDENLVRNNILDMYPKIEYKIDFYPYFRSTEIKIVNEIQKNGMIYLGKNNRYRIKIPNLFINFCEINPEKDKVLLFFLEDEIEIWTKARWDNYASKIVWISEEGKYIYKTSTGADVFLSTKDNPIFYFLMNSKSRTNQKENK